MQQDSTPVAREGFVERANLSTLEFIALAALLTAMGAMSIDMMLPVLPQIGASFDIADENSRQLVVVAFSLSFAIGQIVFGPLSDRFGRKPLLLLGVITYVAGAAGSALSTTFEWLLALRFIQGLGASALRVVITATVRDCFAGSAMGRAMTFVFTVFMIVPMVAPFVGLGIASVWGWHAIFWFMVLMALIAGLWIAIRLRETLAPNNRRSLKPRTIFESVIEIFTNRTAAGYTIAVTASSAGLMSYIVSAQQVFAELYGLGNMFPVAFAGTALAIAISSLYATRPIRLFGARFVTHIALTASAVSGLALFAYSLSGTPPLTFALISVTISMAAVGIMQGNANAIALEALGHIAGIASSVIGAISTTFATLIGGLVGQAYNGTVQPLALAFGVGCAAALSAIFWAEKGRLFFKQM